MFCLLRNLIFYKHCPIWMKLYTRYTVFIKTYFLFWIHCNNLNQIWMGMVYKDFLSLYRTTCPPFFIFKFLNTSMNSVISFQTFIRGGPEEHIRSSMLLMSRLLIRLLYNYIKQTDWSIIWFSRHVESIPFIFTTKTKLTSNNVSSYSAFHTFPKTVKSRCPVRAVLKSIGPIAPKCVPRWYYLYFRLSKYTQHTS